MKLNNRFIFGILSLLLAAVIAFVALPTIARQTNGKEEIVRITQPVLKGEQISSENAEVVEVGGYNLPSNIAHQLSDVNGLYATADLAVGDYILTSKISSVPVSSDVALNSIPLKKWIYKPGVEEVNINAYNDIEVIESSGRSIKIPDKFSSPQHAIDVIRRMLNACGMVIDDTMPSIVGFLDKNIRISVDKTPIVDADVGVNASIRIVNQQTVSEEKLLNSGSATAEMLHFLTACIRYGVSVCIAGSTGSGKTTIMAWLLSNVPNNRRLITIEEGSREFDLVKRDAQGNILNSVVHLLTRPSENPALNINQDFLLERVLRKHPDVIGVGEMRSAAESLSAAESSRTGHTVCTTIHSNSCNSTYRRMMTLAKRKYNMDDSILMQIMVEAYPIIVFTKQLEDRSRKIMEIIEGEDYRDGRLIAHSLYKYEVEDNVTDDRGETRVVGHHKKIGLISDSLKKRLLDNGISNKELEEFMQPPKEVG